MGISIGARMATDKSGIVNRLKRIEGQVRGVSHMVAEERYCIDILHQIQAVKAALAKVEGALLKNHAACCVREAINSGDTQKQQVKFNELIDLFEQVKR